MKLLKTPLALLFFSLLFGCGEREFPDNANLPAEGPGASNTVAEPVRIQIPAADSSSLFVGVNLAKLKERDKSAILQAITDFDRVKNGMPPTCKDEPDSAFSDGGTALYECKHYQLMVMKSNYHVGDNQGYIYGPVITFPGDYPISDVRFYTTAELQALLNRSGL